MKSIYKTSFPTDQFTQEWRSIIYHSQKCLSYRLFKESLMLESYLFILPRKYATILCKFRCNNFKLPIECGRWNNTPRNLRFCSLCNQNNVGDEYHYIFECTHYDIAFARKSFLSEKLIKKPNVIKFKELFTTSNFAQLKNLCKFLFVLKKHMIWFLNIFPSYFLIHLMWNSIYLFLFFYVHSIIKIHVH